MEVGVEEDKDSDNEINSMLECKVSSSVIPIMLNSHDGVSW